MPQWASKLLAKLASSVSNYLVGFVSWELGQQYRNRDIGQRLHRTDWRQSSRIIFGRINCDSGRLFSDDDFDDDSSSDDDDFDLDNFNDDLDVDIINNLDDDDSSALLWGSLLFRRD